MIAVIGEDVPTRSNGGGSSKPAAPAAAPAPVQQAERKREAAAEYDTPLPATAAASKAVNGNGAERLKASPLARSVAKQRGIDIARITGTGPLGRIIEADVLAFASTPLVSAPVSTPRVSASPAPQTAPTELSAMRKVIARRMAESKTTIPHFYITAPKWTWLKPWPCAKS